MSVSCQCCVLSRRGLCVELITRPEESYRVVLRCVWSRHLKNEEAISRVGPEKKKKKAFEMTYLSVLIIHVCALCSLPKATNERLACSKPTV